MEVECRRGEGSDCEAFEKKVRTVLAMKTIATTDIWDLLAEAVGLGLGGLVLLARFCLLEQLSP